MIAPEKLTTLRKVAPVWTRMLETMDRLPCSGFANPIKEICTLYKCPDLGNEQTCIVGEVNGWSKTYNCMNCGYYCLTLYSRYKWGSGFEDELKEYQEHIEDEHLV